MLEVKTKDSVDINPLHGLWKSTYSGSLCAVHNDMLIVLVPGALSAFKSNEAAARNMYDGKCLLSYEGNNWKEGKYDISGNTLILTWSNGESGILTKVEDL